LVKRHVPPPGGDPVEGGVVDADAGLVGERAHRHGLDDSTGSFWSRAAGWPAPWRSIRGGRSFLAMLIVDGWLSRPLNEKASRPRSPVA
jgi:hypothetical protein